MQFGSHEFFKGLQEERETCTGMPVFPLIPALPNAQTVLCNPRGCLERSDWTKWEVFLFPLMTTAEAAPNLSTGKQK